MRRSHNLCAALILVALALELVGCDGMGSIDTEAPGTVVPLRTWREPVALYSPGQQDGALILGPLGVAQGTAGRLHLLVREAGDVGPEGEPRYDLRILTYAGGHWTTRQVLSRYGWVPTAAVGEAGGTVHLFWQGYAPEDWATPLRPWQADHLYHCNLSAGCVPEALTPTPDGIPVPSPLQVATGQGELYLTQQASLGTTIATYTDRGQDHHIGGGHSPYVAIGADGLHLVSVDPGTGGLMYQRETDGLWAPPVTIAPTPERAATHPSLLAQGDTLHVVYFSDHTGDTPAVHYARSTDGGQQWTNRVIHRGHTGAAITPATMGMTWEGVLHVVYALAEGHAPNGNAPDGSASVINHYAQVYDDAVKRREVLLPGVEMLSPAFFIQDDQGDGHVVFYGTSGHVYHAQWTTNRGL